MGSSGDKPQTGETSIAITDHHGYVVAPVPGAPVHETDMVLCPEGLHALKQVAPAVGVDLRGAYLNRDGGFDAARHRQGILVSFNQERQRESIIWWGVSVTINE